MSLQVGIRLSLMASANRSTIGRPLSTAMAVSIWPIWPRHLRATEQGHNDRLHAGARGRRGLPYPDLRTTRVK